MLHFIFQKDGIEKESKAEATTENWRLRWILFQASLLLLSQGKCGGGLLETLHFPESTTYHSERKHVVKLLGEFAVLRLRAS